MALGRDGGSPHRTRALVGCLVLLLGGCTAVPVPMPVPTPVPVPTHSQPGPPPPVTETPQPETPSSSLRELQAMLEQYSTELLREGAPAVLIHAKDGDEEWVHAAGARSRGGGAVLPGDRMQVGGVTRSMVAVSVLKLVEDGRLALDDPITKYLPELDGPLDPPVPLTVRRLLAHTSGMPDYYPPLLRSAPPGQVLATPISPLQRLALAGSVPWQAPKPLSLSARSDYEALGLLLEKLRGKPLAEVLRADILEPLGLRSTSMIGDGAAPARLVHGYVLVDGVPVDAAYSPMQRGSASNGMVSSLEDVNAFYAALLRGRLLSPASLVEMKGFVYAGYGLGLNQWNDRCTNGSYYGHSGDVPGYGTVAISSADGERQLAMSVAYPPSALSALPHAIALEITVLAQRALNAACTFQFF